MGLQLLVAEGAGWISFPRFDLDDVGAVLGENHSCEGGRYQLAELNDSDTGEWCRPATRHQG